MAKKRNKKKEKKRNKKQEAGLSNVDSQINEIKKLLALGSVRKASAIGYMLLTRPALTDEHIELIIETQTLRLREMISNHQISKASSKLNNILKYHPEWQTLFSQELLLKLDLEGESDLIIRNYGIDVQSTKIVDDYIQNELRDIRPLSLHPKLSGEHLLKKQSGVLLAAWEEIESQMVVSENFEIMLKTIGRKSPFVGWRLFIQGLNCWYNSDDEKAKKFLIKAIEIESVKNISDILINIIKNKKQLSKAGQFIEQKLSRNEKYHQLCKLSRELKFEPTRKLAIKVIDFIKNPIYPNMPILHKELSAMIFEPLSGPEPEDDWAYPLVDDDYGLDINNEILPLNLKADILNDDCLLQDWEDYLEIEDGNLTNIDKSLIYLHVAEDSKKMLDKLDEPSDLSNILKRFSDDELPENSPQKRDLISKAISSLKKSIKFNETREAYRLWYDLELQKEKIYKTNIISPLTHWSIDFPNDIDPLLLQMKLEFDVKNFKKALKILDKAEKIEPRNIDVFAFRYKIILEYALDLIIKNKMKKAIGLLDSISTKIPAFFLIVAKILRYFAGRITPPERLVLLNEIKNLNQPLTVECICKHLKGKISESESDILLLLGFNEDSLKKFEVVIDNFLMFNDKNIIETIWNPLPYVLNIGIIKKAFEVTEMTAEQIKTALEIVVDISRSKKKFIWLLTAKGLKAENSRLDYFLISRATVLADTKNRNRTIECMLAAEFIALKDNNASIMTEFKRIAVKNLISPALLNQKLSQKTVDKIVEFEKQFDKPADAKCKRTENPKKKKEKPVFKPKPKKKDKKNQQLELF